jgi:hypothetical protein
VKLLSNPSQRFVAAFIGPGLPPSSKQFRVEREIEFSRVSVRALRRLARRSSPTRPPHTTEAFSPPSGHLPHPTKRGATRSLRAKAR